MNQTRTSVVAGVIQRRKFGQVDNKNADVQLPDKHANSLPINSSNQNNLNVLKNSKVNELQELKEQEESIYSQSVVPDEENEALSRGNRSRSKSKSRASQSQRGSQMSDNDNMDERSFRRHTSGASLIDEEIENAKSQKFIWPEGTASKIAFTIFLPAHFIYYYIVPDVKVKPDISKLILCCIVVNFISAAFAYGIFQLEIYILLASNMKMEYFGIINGLLFGLM